MWCVYILFVCVEMRRILHKESMADGTFVLLIGCRQQDVFHARPSDEPRLTQIINRQDEATRYFGA